MPRFDVSDLPRSLRALADLLEAESTAVREASASWSMEWPTEYAPPLVIQSIHLEVTSPGKP